jgi:AraC-like DNA-binding protein
MPAMNKLLTDVDLPDWAPLPQAAHFGWIRYRPGGRFGPRVQADVQLVMLDSGSLTVRVNGRPRRLAVGAVCCLWPQAWEVFTFDRHHTSVHRWISLTMPPAVLRSGWLAAARRRAPFARPETKALRDIFQLGRRRQLQRGCDQALCHLGMAYLTAYLTPDDALTVTGRTPAFHAPTAPVVAALNLINDRWNQPLTLDDLAHAARTSNAHLVRLFRQQFDITPIKLLWQTRMARAADLLSVTSHSIAEIAYRVGCASPSHFSRLFRAQLGASPKSWRQQLWRSGGFDPASADSVS